MKAKALGMMLYKVDITSSKQDQRENSRWTHSLKGASSIIERNKERWLYGEREAARCSYCTGKGKKTGVVT